MRNALTIVMSPSYFWCDSQITLAYIKNESRRFHTFVSNRVSIVRNRSHSHQWHHISGRENPADLVSRGVHLKSLDKQLWLYGPSFLSTYRGNWPTQNVVSYNVPDDDPESMTAEKIVFCTATFGHPVDKICHHFSSWYKIKCAVA